MTASTRLAGAIPPGTKAYVVEDSAATRRIFLALLRALGVEGAAAENGERALAHLRDHVAEYDVVFTDISMPKMDGFELCHRLQQASWYDGTPLVMVSTQSDAANVIRALKLGADDYLPKPFDKEVLARIVGRVLRHA